MSSLRIMIGNIFKGAGKSFYRFPATIISALIISIIAIVRITMTSEVQETYNLLFDSIQLSFLLGAVFSMAAVILKEIKSNKKSFFLLANLSGILLAIISFLILYFFGRGIPEGNTIYLSDIAIARVNVAIFISVLAFIYLISKAKSVDSFSSSFFITQKAFVISAIYGFVIMSGVSAVLGAFQALVYRGMDFRVYQYLGVIVGFLTYTIFLGYFPSFKGMEDEEEIEKIEEESRFIFVLFEYILIPIIMALTLVLLLWSIRVIISGIKVSFNQLSAISSTYIIIGIWLHIMVAKHQSKLSYFYKKIYPFAGILILMFEAWALFLQINEFGLKTEEYSFLMIWIFAIISIFLLIFLNEKAYRKIAITAVVVAVVWVMPIIGYQDITFNSQVNRLKEILTNQGLLVNNEIVISKSEEIKDVKKGEITDAVDFIAYSEKTNTPSWFKKDLNDEEIFENTFGFEKTYIFASDSSEYNSAYFELETETIDISDYSLSLNIMANEMVDGLITFEGEKGIYEMTISNNSGGIPEVTVKLEENIIIEENMSNYLSNLTRKYQSEEVRETKLAFEDMSVVLETEDLSILLVFNNIESYFDESMGERDYYVNFQGIYIKYK